MSTRDVVEAGVTSTESEPRALELASSGMRAAQLAIVAAVLAIATLVVPLITRPLEDANYEDVLAGWSQAGTGGSGVGRTADSQIDVLFLGNSLVQWGVDLEAFRRQSGRTARRLWAASSAGGWWYLVIDRVVSEAARPPKLIVLCFDDDTLTRTTLFNEEEALDRLAGRFDEERHAAAKSRIERSAHTPTVAFLHRHWPLVDARSNARRSLEGAVRRYIGSVAGGSNKLEASMDRTFALERKDAEVLDAKAQPGTFDPRRYDFASVKERSFLPDMLDSAAAYGVRLVFVRMPRKATADRRPDVAREIALRRYSVDLAAYLEQSGYPLLDFSTFEGLDTERDFEAGDHLTESGRAIFMPALLTALKPHLPRQP